MGRFDKDTEADRLSDSRYPSAGQEQRAREEAPVYESVPEPLPEPLLLRVRRQDIKRALDELYGRTDAKDKTTDSEN